MTSLAMCFDTKTFQGDLTLPGVRESQTDFIANAVRASLFTNRRSPEQRAGGCWSDALYEDSFGSLLWTKQREKITATLLVELDLICREALRWLVDGGYVKAIDVAVERSSSTAHGVDITITVHGNDDETSNQVERFDLGGLS